MLLIAITWLVCIVLICGFGSIVPILFRLEINSIEKWFLSFWLGFSLIILFLQIWHFLFPVNDWARLTISIIALVGLVLNHHNLRITKTDFRVYPLLGILIIWLANRSMGEPVYDSGLYHLQAINWSSTFPIVPGLGNLHSRLAHNSAFFLFGALLNTGPWLGRTHHVVNGILFLVLLAQFISKRPIFIQYFYIVSDFVFVAKTGSR